MKINRTSTLNSNLFALPPNFALSLRFEFARFVFVSSAGGGGGLGEFRRASSFCYDKGGLQNDDVRGGGFVRNGAVARAFRSPFSEARIKELCGTHEENNV